jgi:hypothetical protein
LTRLRKPPGLKVKGHVELRGSGPDAVPGNSDDELFATQGVFLL